MIKNMNSKMTTTRYDNPQLPTTKPKNENKNKNKVSKQLEQEQTHRNRDHLEGYQQEGGGREWGKGTGNKKHKL